MRKCIKKKCRFFKICHEYIEAPCTWPSYSENPDMLVKMPPPELKEGLN